MERVQLPGSPLDDELPRAAEERYWETYADALYDLNTSRLSEVAAGEELARMIGKVEELRARNRRSSIHFKSLQLRGQCHRGKAFMWDRATTEAAPSSTGNQDSQFRSLADPIRRLGTRFMSTRSSGSAERGR